MKKLKRNTRKSKSTRKKSARKKPTDITIRRSSGRKEKFDRDRLASTTSRSGVPFLMARDIAKKVTRQVRAESRGKKKTTLTGGRVRRIIGKELQNRNAKIASAYRGGNDPQIPSQKMHLPKPTVGSADTNQHGVYRADRDSIMHDKSKRLTSTR